MAFKLKDINEFKKLKICAITEPVIRAHADNEWFVEMCSKYTFPGAVTQFDCLNRQYIGFAYNSAVSKEMLFVMMKFSNIAFYTDYYFEPAQKQRSVDLLKELGKQILNTLEEGKCGDELSYVGRTVATVAEIKRALNAEQSQIFMKYITDSFKAHINYNKNYYLENKVIPYNQYFALRSDESFVRCLLFLVEYTLDYAVPTTTRHNPLFIEFTETTIAYNLALDDYLMLKSKLAHNDDTNAIISYAVDNDCPLQVAVDYHYNYLLTLEKRCKQLMTEIAVNKDIYTKELQIYMEARMTTVKAFIQMVFKAWKLEVMPDQTINTTKWDQLYQKMLNNQSPDTMPWSI